MNPRGFLLSLFLLASCALSGCGTGAEGAGRKPVFESTGTVKLFGAPLGEATVTFAPMDGQPTAFGTTDDQGVFKLTTYDFGDGAAAGNYKVVVTKFAEAGASSAPAAGGSDHEAAEAALGEHDAKGQGDAKALVPTVFTSVDTTTLTAEVKSDSENKFSFELK